MHCATRQLLNACRRQRRQRAAFSLVEVLVCIALGAVILGLGYEVLSRALRETTNERQHLQQTQTLARVTEQLRGDVHEASGAELTGDARPAQELKLTREAGEPVTYTIERGVLWRRTQLDDARQHESFRLAGWQPLGFELPEPNTVALKFAREPAAANPADEAEQRELVITASVGRDQRFQTAAPQEAGP